MGKSPFVLAVRRFATRPAAVFGLVVIVLFVAAALLAPWISPYDPTRQSYSVIRKAPSALHWFGTDENGRDVLARVLFGARATLLAGLVSVSIAAGAGVPLGLLAGFAGGWTDAVIGRLVDAMLACPFLILAIALAAFLGPSLTNAMIAIGVTATPVFVRVARAATIEAAANDYVEAARALGNPPWRVAARHVLPEHRATHPGAGDAGHRHGDHRRGQPVLPRPRAAAAGAVLGLDAELGPAFPDPGAVARDLPRGGDLPDRAGLQPDRRRPARRAGPPPALTPLPGGCVIPPNRMGRD